MHIFYTNTNCSRTVLHHFWSTWSKYSVGVCIWIRNFSLCLLVFHEHVHWHPTFIHVIFLVSFSEKYKFAFLEMVVNELTVIPFNLELCWLLLKVLHLGCIPKQWRIRAFGKFWGGSCWFRFTGIASVFTSLGFSGFLCLYARVLSFLHAVDLRRYLPTSVILAVCGPWDIRAVEIVCQVLFSTVWS